MRTVKSPTAFEAIAGVLVEQGVTEVFGLMGDDTIRLVTELAGLGVPYHNARHENAAIAMASGYASMAGRLGVAIISRGAGTTNGLTAAVNAARGDAPVLVITGDESVQTPRNSLRVPDPKAVGVRLMAEGAGIPIFTPRSAAAVRSTVREAIAVTGLGRTALLTVPIDIFESPVGIESPGEAIAPRTPEAQPARDAAVRAAVSVLAAARRPLILAGWGAWASGAGPGLVELADRIGAVLATSMRGKDMFRGHPYNAGIMGSFSHSAGRRLFDQADAVIAFGASLNRYTTNDGSSLPAVPVIHVDTSRASIGRYHWADVAVIGDARLVAAQLVDALPPREAADKPFHSEANRRLLADFDLAEDFDPVSTRWTLDPRTLLLELDRMLPAERAVASDNGNFFGFIPTHLSIPSPAHFKLGSDFAVIGLGLGTGIGVAIARRDLQTYCFAGDGGLLMSLGELETVARLGVPLTVIVMNDSAYGAEKHFLELRGIPGSSAEFPDTDFAPVAEAFGIEAATVRTLDDLRALAPALGKRDSPLLVDCKVSSVVAPFLSELLPESARPGDPEPSLDG